MNRRQLRVLNKLKYIYIYIEREREKEIIDTDNFL